MYHIKGRTVFPFKGGEITEPKINSTSVSFALLYFAFPKGMADENVQLYYDYCFVPLWHSVTLENICIKDLDCFLFINHNIISECHQR